jgi:hypothetical protein
METNYPYLVCMPNGFTLLGFEYFSPGEGVIIGSHNPYKAKRFANKDDAKEFLKLFDMEGAKIDRADTHLQKFDRCDYKYMEINLLDPTFDIPYNSHSPQEVISWWINIKKLDEREVSSKNYQTWPKPWTVTSHLWDISVYNSRINRETYTTFEVFTRRDGDFIKFQSEIEMVKSHCTFIGEDGYIRFPIIDRELSEYEKREFLYKTESDCKITNIRYDLFKGTMDQCFEKMKLSYWYE